jgi:exosortase/archaeosortase family protein
MGLWTASLLFARYALMLVHATIAQRTWTHNFFPIFAWFVLFRVLAKSSRLGPAQSSDVGAFLLCGAIACLPGDNVIWIAITLAAAYFFASGEKDLYRASAAALLIALATNGIWGPMLFKLLGAWLMDFDAWLVAKVLEVAGLLTSYSGDEVVIGRGDIEIGAPCSSFNNISMALLAWVSLTKLFRPYWLRVDLAVAAACIVVTLVWNTARLALLGIYATNESVFTFWHDGTGAQIFATVLGFLVALISVAGASRRPA